MCHGVTQMCHICGRWQESYQSSVKLWPVSTSSQLSDIQLVYNRFYFAFRALLGESWTIDILCSSCLEPFQKPILLRSTHKTVENSMIRFNGSLEFASLHKELGFLWPEMELLWKTRPKLLCSPRYRIVLWRASAARGWCRWVISSPIWMHSADTDTWVTKIRVRIPQHQMARTGNEAD